MKSFVLLGLGLLVFGLGMPAVAMTSAQKSKVLGWTATGNEIVVEREHLGQLMVDDVAQEFYFETTSTYRAKDGSQLLTYRRGELSGPKHPVWEGAKEVGQLDKFLETAGLMEAQESWLSPDQKSLLAVTERTMFSEESRCEVHHRVVLMRPDDSKLYVVHDQIARGEHSDSRDLATCPQVKIRAFWHPSSKLWVLERERTRPDHKWTLIPGSLESLEEYADSTFVTSHFNRELVMSKLDDGVVKDALRETFNGRLKTGLSKIAQDPSGSKSKVLLMALLFALDQKTEPAKKLLKDRSLRELSILEEGLKAAVQTAVGDVNAASKSINALVKGATSWQDLAAVAGIFSLVDLNASNEIYVHALSHETAAEADTNRAYTAMIQGLIEAGQLNAAQSLIDKLDSLDSAQKLLMVSLNLAYRRPQLARETLEEILAAEPGRCAAWAASARMAAMERRMGDALEHYRAAATCNPLLVDASFYVADLELRRGDLRLGKVYLQKFIDHTIGRRSDLARQVRLDWAQQGLKRLEHQGAVLLTTSCFPSNTRTVCQGTVFNTSEETLSAVEARVSSKDKRGRLKTLGTASVDELAPGATATLSVMVDEEPAVMSVGRDPAEHKTNEVDIL